MASCSEMREELWIAVGLPAFPAVAGRCGVASLLRDALVATGALHVELSQIKQPPYLPGSAHWEA